MSRHILRILTTVTFVCILFGCTKRESTKIQIGAIFDLTGSLSYMGKWSQQGAQMAIDELNQKHSAATTAVQLLVEDGETKPDKTVSAFRKLIDFDHVQIVIGFNSSSGVMAAAPIANEKKILLFSTGGASPSITNAGDYVFRNRLSGALEVSAMADIAVDSLKIRRLGILYINNDYGTGYRDVFREKFIERGGSVVIEEGFEQDKTDFRTHILKFKSESSLQAVYLIPYAKEGGYILKQSKELGFATTWLSANAIEGPQLFEIAGDAAEGLMYTVARYDPADSLAIEFNRRYKAKFGIDSEMFAANAYDAVMILSEAISQVGATGPALKEYLYHMRPYKGVSGWTSFDRNGDVIKSVMIKIVHNGRFVPYSF